jgi:hypothetical protein
VEGPVWHEPTAGFRGTTRPVWITGDVPWQEARAVIPATVLDPEVTVTVGGRHPAGVPASAGGEGLSNH